jgi:hypothetical protein
MKDIPNPGWRAFLQAAGPEEKAQADPGELSSYKL